MGENNPSVPSSKAQGGKETHFKYTALQGYFQQAEPDIDDDSYDPKLDNFGLVSQPYETDSSLDRRQEHTDWQRFAHHVSSLNSKASKGTSYRLLFLGRHGQGYHNIAYEFYGIPAWECYYASFDGDPHEGSTITWVDAHLTLLGQDQARNMSEFWRSQLKTQKMPTPQSYYVSPMDRACRTAELTFNTLAKDGLLANAAPFKPTVKELLREENGIHTCDKRSSKSYIAGQYKYYDIEPGFTEEDQLFDPDLRESKSAHTARMMELLDDILGSDASTYISVTSHGGTTSAILRAIGHREYRLPVGSAIPVLLKTETMEGPRKQIPADPWEPKPKCVEDPLKAGQKGYANLMEYVREAERQYRKGNQEEAERMTGMELSSSSV